MILETIRALAMSTALARGLVVNKVPPATALHHTYLVMKETDRQPRRALLLAIAKGETDFNRVEHPGKGQCGVTQIETYSDRALCRRLADDPGLAYRLANDELDRWVKVCRRAGRRDRACALAAYGDGGVAVKAPTPAWVTRRLRMADALERR